jgi:hypothetical protein
VQQHKPNGATRCRLSLRVRWLEPAIRIAKPVAIRIAARCTAVPCDAPGVWCSEVIGSTPERQRAFYQDDCKRSPNW